MSEVGAGGFSSFASKWKIDNVKTTKPAHINQRSQSLIVTVPIKSKIIIYNFFNMIIFCTLIHRRLSREIATLSLFFFGVMQI